MTPETEDASHAATGAEAADVAVRLEGVLFVADSPVTLEALAAALDEDEQVVETGLSDLAAALEGRGITLRQVAGGWRLYSAPEARDAVESFVLAGRSARLSQAALETLAVIAYKQPISRADVSDIRGVNADGAVRSLVSRGLVEEAGRDEGPGQAILYGTTQEFLEKLGLGSVDELPDLADFLPSEAPDEPGPDHDRAARDHLASRGDLPATGRARWDPEAVAARAEQEGEMAELTARLEAVSKSAMTQLKRAVSATEDEEEPEPETPSGAAGDSDDHHDAGGTDA